MQRVAIFGDGAERHSDTLRSRPELPPSARAIVSAVPRSIQSANLRQQASALAAPSGRNIAEFVSLSVNTAGKHRADPMATLDLRDAQRHWCKSRLGANQRTNSDMRWD